MTNGDKIRSMTDRKLAKIMASHIDDCDDCPLQEFCESQPDAATIGCKATIVRWLKQEAKDGEI